MSNEKTEYRAVKILTFGTQYQLQFKSKSKFLLWEFDNWNCIPREDAYIHCFFTSENSDSFSSDGIGYYSLRQRTADFSEFIEKYHDIQMYFDELNGKRKNWLIEKQKKDSEPKEIYFQ